MAFSKSILIVALLMLSYHFNTSFGFKTKSFRSRKVVVFSESSSNDRSNSEIGNGQECCPPSSRAPSILISDKSSTVAILEAREARTMQPFDLKLEGLPLSNELVDENIVRIVNLEATDAECNSLAWKCLGYRYNIATQQFESSDHVFPKWQAKYPQPPDVIGVKRLYSEDVDKPVRQASMDLMRSIPRDYKGGVRNLKSAGFRGYKLSELTPNKTRRAQLCNWLIYYREKLFGKSFEEIRTEREREKLEKTVDPAVQELPSEKMFQKLRLD